MAYQSWYTGKTVDKGLFHHIHLTSDSSAGSWVGKIGNVDPADPSSSDEGVNTSAFKFQDGIKVLVQMTVAAGASSTTLTLNGNGPYQVYYRYNTTSDKVALTSAHFPVGSVVPLIYCTGKSDDASCWVVVSSAPSKTQAAGSKTYTSSVTGAAVSLKDHSHSVTQTSHSHSFTPKGSVSVATTSTSTGDSTNTPTATLDAAPTYTADGHTHKYDKVTSAKVSVSGTTGEATGSTAGASTTGSVTDTTVTITEPTAGGHSHTYSKAKSSASVTGVGGTTGKQSANGVNVSTTSDDTAVTSDNASAIMTAVYSNYTLSFTTGSFSKSTHKHGYTKPTGSGTMADHTHSFTGASGTATITYETVNTGTTATGITAKLKDGSVAVASHSHGLNSHQHTFSDANRAVDLTYNGGGSQVTTVGTDLVANTGSTQERGTISKPSITLSNYKHSHSYVKPTGSGTFTATAGQTTDGANANIGVDSASVTTSSVSGGSVSITVESHTHDIK